MDDDDWDDDWSWDDDMRSCYGCCDTGYLYHPATRWRRERHTNCPGCNPNRWQEWRNAWWWRWQSFKRKLTPARWRPAYDDEMPF